MVTLYLDELSLYRQPSQASLWFWRGPTQPKMKMAYRSNTRTRIVGTLNAVDGQVLYRQRSRIDRHTFARFLLAVGEGYPDAETIYVVLDNWPVHFHPDVMRRLAGDPRIVLVPLPTYAPWLNPIEKLWRWLKQTMVHTHPYADNFHVFKERINELLDRWENGSPVLLKYVGLQVE